MVRLALLLGQIGNTGSALAQALALCRWNCLVDRLFHEVHFVDEQLLLQKRPSDAILNLFSPRGSLAHRLIKTGKW